MLKRPKVSIIMPTYNRANYIREAIESILEQTYDDFELIIVDDCSNDTTEEVVTSFQDSRILYIKNSENLGVAATRNIGYKNANGEYIVIADSDDINHKDRIKKMVEFLQKNLAYDVVVTDFQIIDDSGKAGSVIETRKTNLELRINWLFQPGIPSFMMFRKDNITKRNLLLHDEDFKAAVDYQWYSNLTDDVQIGVVEEVLYYYRRHTNQISTSGYNIQQHYADTIRKSQLIKIGIEPTEEEMKLHSNISQQSFIELNDEVFTNCIQWFVKIVEANNNCEIFNTEILMRVLSDQLLNLIECQGYVQDSFYDIYINSVFKKYYIPILSNNTAGKVACLIERPANIYIFGAKKLAFETAKFFKSKNIKFNGFIDNNKNLLGKKILGEKIFSVDEIKDEINTYIIITVLSDARYIIYRNLTDQYKIPKKKVIVLADLI